ncbi:hypothetical protein ACA910_004395 [Epithemia clementina (nom. ined.)]
MGKEGSTLIQHHLRELFVEFENAASTGVKTKFDWMPLQDATNADMNAVWKTNEFGCATKTRGNAKPCHCCLLLISNDELVLPKDDKSSCRWCTSSGAAEDDSKRCYHHRIVTEQVAATMEVELSALEDIFKGMLQEVEVFQKESLIHTSDNPKVSIAASSNDASSIHFSITSSMPRNIISEYNSKLVHDLEIRGMDSAGGTLDDRRKRLQTRLVEEWTYVRLKPNVEENRQRAEKAILLIMKTVPCILHAENRIGIKIMTMLLIEGLSNALKGATCGEKAASDEFVSGIEQLVNTQVFGDQNHEAQWQLPLSDHHKQIVQYACPTSGLGRSLRSSSL